MKIASYNLAFLFDEGTHLHSGKEYNFSSDFVNARIDYFAKEFTVLNADFLFLQEVGSEEVLKKIIAKLDIPYGYFIATPDNYGVGNAVLYKDKECKCESVSAMATSMPVFKEGDVDTIGPRIWSRRDFVYVTTMYKESPLHLLGIHLKATFPMFEKDKNDKDLPISTQISMADGLIRSEMFRYSQAKKVREVIDSLFTNDAGAQIVVAGDFNTPSFGVASRMICGDIKDRSDALVHVLNKVPKNLQYSVWAGKENGILVDHILVSKNLLPEVQNATILNENLVSYKDDARFPFIVESDHAPVIFELL